MENFNNGREVSFSYCQSSGWEPGGRHRASRIPEVLDAQDFTPMRTTQKFRNTDYGRSSRRSKPAGLNRHARRRLDREIRKVIEQDGDHCSLCRAPLVHNCKTFYGVAFNGAVVCVGECCVGQLQTILASGVFCAAERAHEFPPGNGKEPSSPEEIQKAVEALQKYITAADQMCSTIGKRAGLPEGSPSAVRIADNPWKSNDRDWFEAHPDRSHRLRRLFPGEPYYRGNEPPVVPPGHEMQVLIRQVRPGVRVRGTFARNLKVDIPDIEAILHALFDVVSESHDRNTPISVAEIGRLAEKYAGAAGPL